MPISKHTKYLRRWLKALQIAKDLFEEDGYHTKYLEQIEQYIIRLHPQLNRIESLLKRSDGRVQS